MTRGHDDWGGGLPRGTPAIVADTAPSTAATLRMRGSCSGLGCRRTIDKGELRLQVGIPGVWKGVGEAVSGFYCFQSEIGGEPCLFKTFKGDKGFKYGADQIPLAKPKSTADIGGFGALSAEHQQIVTSAVQGTYSWTTTCTTVPKDRVLTLTPTSNGIGIGIGIGIGGDTFAAKDALKKLGCKWNRECKVWIATGAAVDKLLNASSADVDTKNFFEAGVAVTVPLSTLLKHLDADVNPVTTVPVVAAAAVAPGRPRADTVSAVVLVAAAAVAPPLPQTEPPETAAPPPPMPLSAPPKSASTTLIAGLTATGSGRWELGLLSSPASAVVLTVADVDAMKGVQLKNELRKRALTQSGNKSELVKRLKASITN